MCDPGEVNGQGNAGLLLAHSSALWGLQHCKGSHNKGTIIKLQPPAEILGQKGRQGFSENRRKSVPKGAC
jgi:hypothetical protein